MSSQCDDIHLRRVDSVPSGVHESDLCVALIPCVYDQTRKDVVLSVAIVS